MLYNNIRIYSNILYLLLGSRQHTYSHFFLQILMYLYINIKLQNVKPRSKFQQCIKQIGIFKKNAITF